MHAIDIAYKDRKSDDKRIRRYHYLEEVWEEFYQKGDYLLEGISYRQPQTFCPWLELFALYLISRGKSGGTICFGCHFPNKSACVPVRSRYISFPSIRYMSSQSGEM